MTAFADIEKVLPKVVEVTAAGETIAVRPFGLRKLKEVAPHVALIAYLLSQIDGDKEPDWVGLIMQGGDSLFELLSIAIGKPLEWFDDLNPVEGALLAMAVVEVNLDFFGNWQQHSKQLSDKASALLSRVKHS